MNLNEVLPEIKIERSERDVVNEDDMTMPDALIAQFTGYLRRILCFWYLIFIIDILSINSNIIWLNSILYNKYKYLWVYLYALEMCIISDHKIWPHIILLNFTKIKKLNFSKSFVQNLNMNYLFSPVTCTGVFLGLIWYWK